MKKIADIINEVVQQGFEECHYSQRHGKTTLSHRPDLCHYQCNGALSAAKAYQKSPLTIAEEVVNQLNKSSYFKQVTWVKPGFINLTLADKLITGYINDMHTLPKYGCDDIGDNKTIIVDYGGPNIAKPLHVGHLRTAIIGESIKRLGSFLGFHMLGDVHLGDWGLQIGLIIAELERQQPHLIYFDNAYTDLYPLEPPFTIKQLAEVYPRASTLAKEDVTFMEKAKEATYLFQTGKHKGYLALWKHILNVSIKDLKKNYNELNVHFELWKKESDVMPYISNMIDNLKEQGLAYISDGALVVDVKKDTDNKEMPPCILVKSDGATLYSTTDLATLVERVNLYNPSEIIYIVDKRQKLHFEQVFRCAEIAGIVPPTTKLTFLGFGTMNGADGKPFKTRDGGVMGLEKLVTDTYEEVHQKINSTESISKEESNEIAKKVGISALKYGDLSNQITKDYVFDPERFTSFEGNTGPYIQYTVVRIKSILNKFYGLHVGISDANDTDKIKQLLGTTIQLPQSDLERNLMLKLIQFSEVIANSFMEYAPHRLCQYVYDVANTFNKFYHHTRILSEANETIQHSWIQLLSLTENILVCSLDLLGIEVPNKM